MLLMESIQGPHKSPLVLCRRNGKLIFAVIALEDDLVVFGVDQHDLP
jgi:hypothetical protein